MSIIWTHRAKNDYWQNITYLETEWTLNEVYDFMDKVDHVLALLVQENLVFKPTEFPSVFVVPITKHISLYYQVAEPQEIILMRFWNTYQNPEKFRL